MKYLLANDTSETNNPGCKGTIAYLRRILKSQDHEEVAVFPVGFGRRNFSCCTGQRGVRIKAKLIGFFRTAHCSPYPQVDTITPAWDYPAPKVSIRRWEAAKKQLRRQLAAKFASAEKLIINAEGTLHHNGPSALALLAMAAAAKEAGLRVEIVNGSVQNMDTRLLQRVMRTCDTVIVREPYSYRYLQELGVPAQVAPDCLFLHSGENRQKQTSQAMCLYTPGVLSVTGHLTVQGVDAHIALLKSHGYTVTFLTVERADERFHDAAIANGCRLIRLNEIPWRKLGEFVTNYDLVVSGRYHIVIFSWLAGRPVIPMQSNSWKVEGLLRLVGERSMPVRDCDRLPGWIDRGGVLPDRKVLRALRKSCISQYVEARNAGSDDAWVAELLDEVRDPQQGPNQCAVLGVRNPVVDGPDRLSA